MTQMARIVIADDHPDMLEELCALLAPTFEIVGAVADGVALFDATVRVRPDAVVSDVAMPVMGGLAAAKLILRDVPDTRIVFVSALNDPSIAQRCLDVGGCGFVSKTAAGSDLIPAVQAALRGERLPAFRARRDCEDV